MFSDVAMLNLSLVSAIFLKSSSWLYAFLMIIFYPFTFSELWREVYQIVFFSHLDLNFTVKILKVLIFLQLWSFRSIGIVLGIEFAVFCCVFFADTNFVESDNRNQKTPSSRSQFIKASARISWKFGLQFEKPTRRVSDGKHKIDQRLGNSFFLWIKDKFNLSIWRNCLAISAAFQWSLLLNSFVESLFCWMFFKIRHMNY